MRLKTEIYVCVLFKGNWLDSTSKTESLNQYNVHIYRAHVGERAKRKNMTAIKCKDAVENFIFTAVKQQIGTRFLSVSLKNVFIKLQQEGFIQMFYQALNKTPVF